jgi:hypothetical protein
MFARTLESLLNTIERLIWQRFNLEISTCNRCWSGLACMGKRSTKGDCQGVGGSTENGKKSGFSLHQTMHGWKGLGWINASINLSCSAGLSKRRRLSLSNKLEGFFIIVKLKITRFPAGNRPRSKLALNSCFSFSFRSRAAAGWGFWACL